ncbi:MAG: hypothetical protein AAGC95_18340 [Pseudomonadota bacterium]
MADDPFEGVQTGLASPAAQYVSVSPSDGTDLPGGVCRGLLVGVGGAATIVDATGTERIGVPLQAGYNPLRAARVKATGLSASNIWALY